MIMCTLESVQLVVFIFTTESGHLRDVETSWMNVGLNRVMHILHEIGCTDVPNDNVYTECN